MVLINYGQYDKALTILSRNPDSQQWPPPAALAPIPGVTRRTSGRQPADHQGSPAGPSTGKPIPAPPNPKQP
ncbi:MAG: hypothetical protein JST42_06355 [Bacteroidetes bacterium]|nr:hypothetical protein [Bacteroidota bacterium]